jgi:hypothetical protein
MMKGKFRPLLIVILFVLVVVILAVLALSPGFFWS